MGLLGPGPLPAPGYTARRMPVRSEHGVRQHRAASSRRDALGSKAQIALGQKGPGANSRWFLHGPPIRQDYGEFARRGLAEDWIRPRGISKHGPFQGPCFPNPVLKESLFYWKDSARVWKDQSSKGAPLPRRPSANRPPKGRGPARGWRPQSLGWRPARPGDSQGRSRPWGPGSGSKPRWGGP